MNCDWELDGDYIRCRREGCGRKLRSQDLQLRARCRAPSRGFGDTIAKITSAVGIPPCGGCEDRQDRLNELFPYS